MPAVSRKPARAPARHLKAVPDGDPVAAAIHSHAEAMLEVAAAIRENTEQRKAADDFFAEASSRLNHLCQFLKRKGPWLLASIPPTLVAIGAIAPNAAEQLAKVVNAFNH